MIDLATWAGFWSLRRLIEKPGPKFWRLMMVCRHWREVIVGTMMFWRFVNLTDATEWTELCLARSVAAPVDLLAQIPYWKQQRRIEDFKDVYLYFTDLYPRIRDRIRNLYFVLRNERSQEDGMDPDVLAALPVLFGNGIRGLEMLDLDITHDVRRPCYLPIDLELTRQRFPRLLRLRLTGIVAPRDAALYRQLRTLSLTTCTHNLSCDRFLDALASCTALECLRLSNTLDHLSGDWVQRDPVPWRPLISLPHLNRFTLTKHGAARTSRFLAQFYIRPSVHLGICADASDADVQIPSSDGARTCSVAAMLPLSHAATLEPLAMAKEVHMSMAFSNKVEITSAEPSALALIMRLSPDPPGGGLPAVPRRRGSVADLTRFLGRAPLTSLRISKVPPDAVAVWADVFRTFVLLERLSLEEFGVQTDVGLKNAFLGLHAASAGDADGPVACPSLTHVTVVCIGCTTVYEAVHACIRHRRDRGAVLVDLNLDLWWNWSTCRTRLRDLVDCTKQLRAHGLTVGEIGENLEVAETDSGLRQSE